MTGSTARLVLTDDETTAHIEAWKVLGLFIVLASIASMVVVGALLWAYRATVVVSP